MSTVMIVAAYLLSGALSGLLSGLFGIAGGLVMVPTLLLCFAWTGVPTDAVGPLALGTSLSAIMLTNGLASWFNLQQRVLRDPLSMPTLFLALALALGATAGAIFSTALPRMPLMLCLASFQLAISAWLLRGTFVQSARDNTESKLSPQDRLPTWSSRAFMTLTGFLSAVGGIGGSSLLLPFLRAHGIGQREAAALGTYLSCVVGAAGFVGYGLLSKPKTVLTATIGFVNLPALLCLVAGSLLLVRWGTQLAGRVRPVVLTRYFCILLAVSATRMVLPALGCAPVMS
jgi:uncharacterized membrane protein YfcA